MASITSRMVAPRPRGRMAKPPRFPRREVISSLRARACITFERKLSGAASGFGQIRQQCPALRGQSRQVNHDAHRVIGGAGQLHR